MKLQAFDGGLAIRKRPQFIGANQGVVYSNIDNEKASLVPVRTKLANVINVKKYSHFYEAKDQWVSSAIETDWVEYNKILYSTDGGRPKKFDGTVEQDLGIAPPTSIGSITTSDTLDTVADLTVVAEPIGGGLPSDSLSRYMLINTNGSTWSNGLVMTIDERDRLDVEGNSKFGTLIKTIIHDSTSTTRKIILSKPVGITIGSTGIDVYRQYGNKYYLVGNLANSTSTLTDSVYDITGNTELDEDKFGALQGTYQYELTYVNSLDGAESAPSPVSAELNVTGTVSISGLPISSDLQVDKKRLYRIGGLLTAFTRVVEIPNSQTTYTDSLKDTEVEGSLLETVGSAEAPTGLKYLITAYAMLFAAKDDKLYFTPIDQPDSWPPLFFLNYADPITGLASVANGILVFTKFNTHLVTGTGPNALASQPLRGDQGCIANSSVQSVGDAAIWASTDGLCISNGNDAKVITKNELGKISLTPVSSALHDEVYYLVNSDQTILAMDFRYSKVVKRLSLGVDTLSVGEDVLRGWNDSIFYDMFQGVTFESLSFKSARFIEGRASEYKTYKKVYLYSKGDIIINILIDDVQVATKTMTTEGITTIQVPQSLQRGSFIQFEVSGTGEVYEIEYEVGRRHA